VCIPTGTPGPPGVASTVERPFEGAESDYASCQVTLLAGHFERFLYLRAIFLQQRTWLNTWVRTGSTSNIDDVLQHQSFPVATLAIAMLACLSLSG
jgi:hypothetical protein